MHKHMMTGSDLVLQELMTHVESFQCEAQKVIQSGTTDVTRLQQLLDNGHTLDVDLPEIPKLKQVRTTISVKAQSVERMTEECEVPLPDHYLGF